MVEPLLWIPATLTAAAAQTARNATQRRLTETLGTVGATQVRFLYGFPFALLSLGFMRLGLGEPVPGPDGTTCCSSPEGRSPRSWRPP